MMITAMLLTALVSAAPIAQTPAGSPLKTGARVFVHAMSNDFDTYFKAALKKKKVPVVVVNTREDAEFEIKGTSETEKAGAAKKIMLGSWHSDEQASISMTSIASGEVVYAYSVNKKNTAHGRQTTAEACAKHLGDAIRKK